MMTVEVRLDLASRGETIWLSNEVGFVVMWGRGSLRMFGSTGLSVIGQPVSPLFLSATLLASDSFGL